MRRALGAADCLWRTVTTTRAGAGSAALGRTASRPQRTAHSRRRDALLNPHATGVGAAASLSSSAAWSPSASAASAQAGPAPAGEAEAEAAIHARFRRRTCLVQGASRGLGLEFVRQLLAVPETTVVAACRDPAGAEALQRLLKAEQAQRAGGASDAGGPPYDAVRQRLHVVQLDVCDEDSIQRAAERVSELVDGVDLLLNCSGVLHSGPDGMAPETSYARIRPDLMALSFQTNAIGPLLVCRAMLPLLLRSPRATEAEPALLANMSARVGSISDNRLGGWYSYRASKAALNQLSLTLSLELRRKRAAAAVVLLHPGTCDTDLSRPFQKNVPPEKLFSRERGVRQLLAVLAGLRLEDSGRFLAWDGQEVPW